MDKSGFLYWWLSFDLYYYLLLVGANNVLHSSVKKSTLCEVWHKQKSFAITETITACKFPDYVIPCDYVLIMQLLQQFVILMQNS